ncbi:MAG TPA: tetratricopeptide repeat protein [Bacteroidia bacterium]|nr:tetratricopeptide repeat protein [Bacteroidia bacterium]
MAKKVIILGLLFFAAKLFSQEDATAMAKKYYSSGIDLYNKGDYTKAVEDFSKGIAFRSKITDSYLLCKLYLNRAASRLNLGSHDALDDANQAVALKPEFSRAYYMRAIVYEQIIRDYDKAISDADSALLLKPDDVDFMFVKVRCYGYKKQPEKSLEIINKILESDSKNIEALKQKGAVYLELHKYPESEQSFLKALEYQSNDFGILCDLASVLCEQKKFDGALDYYLKAISADTSQAYIVYSNIAYFIYLDQKDYAKAIEYLNKSIAQNPKFPYAYSNRGYAKYMQGDLKGGMKDVNKSLEVYPKNSYAYKNRALILIAENKISSACADLQRALDLGYTKQYDDEVNELVKKHCK